MLLRKLYAKEFQGLAHANVRLGPVTHLIGLNGQGKTSLAEAIDYALLGETIRGGVLGDVVRIGATKCEVEIVLDDEERTTLGRHRTRAGAGGCVVGEGPVRLPEYDAVVRSAVGDPAAIRCALRSGGLLAMTPGELQRFLAALAGAKFGTQEIAAALGEEVMDAAVRAGLCLPEDLDEFRPMEERAIGARQAAKRRLDSAEADLERAPIVSFDPGEAVPAAVEKRIRVLRQERDAAVRAEAAVSAAAKAKREEKLSSLRARIAALAPRVGSEAPAAGRDGLALERELHAKRREAARLEAELAVTRRQVEGARALAEQKTDADEVLTASVHARERARVNATKEHEAAALRLSHAVAARRYADAALKDAPKGGVCLAACDHCSVAHAAKRRGELEKEAASAAKREAEVRQGAELAERNHQTAQAEHEAAQAAAGRVTAVVALADGTRAVAELDRNATAVRDAERVLLEELEAARRGATEASAQTDRRRDLAKARTQLAALEAEPEVVPPQVSVAEIDTRTAAEEQLLVAAKARESRRVFEAGVEREASSVRDTDLVAKALGAGGARRALIAGGVAPFLGAANEALALFAPEWAVELDAEDFGLVVRQGEATLRPAQLSDGHRTRLLFVLQVAVSRLARIGLVVFDRVELLDGDGLAALDDLVGACVVAGIQVLSLRHGEPPLSVFPGRLAYAIEGGVARRIPSPEAAAPIVELSLVQSDA